jgi:hypothetical protein
MVATCDDTVTPPLVLNEVDYDQPGNDTLEFVEIFTTPGSANTP